MSNDNSDENREESLVEKQLQEILERINYMESVMRIQLGRLYDIERRLGITPPMFLPQPRPAAPPVPQPRLPMEPIVEPRPPAQPLDPPAPPKQATPPWEAPPRDRLTNIGRGT